MIRVLFAATIVGGALFGSLLPITMMLPRLNPGLTAAFYLLLALTLVGTAICGSLTWIGLCRFQRYYRNTGRIPEVGK